MAQNFIQPGRVLTPMLSSAAQSGEPVKIGELVGVCLVDIPAGQSGTVSICGVYELPKATGALTVGAKIYLDATGKLTATATDNAFAGYAAEDAAAGAAHVRVLLNGLPA